MVEEVIEERDEPPSRRTLQRRLAELLKQGRAILVRDGRTVRYPARVKPALAAIRFQRMPLTEPGELYLPFSAKSDEIRDDVRGPLHGREPAG